MPEELLAVVESAVKQGMRKGAAAVEAYASTGSELSIEVRHREVETLKQAEDRGIGIRFFKGKRVGFAFGTEISDEGLNDTLNRAIAAADYTAADEYQRLPEPRGAYPAVDLFDETITAAPVEDKIALALRMEEAALDFDRRVKVIESSTYQEVAGEVAVANSLGISALYRAAVCGLYISLAAEQDGQSETGYALRYGRRYGKLDPQVLGREAAERAVRLLGARTIKTCSVPVVFDPYVAVDIIGLLAPALTAEAVQRGRSLFAGKIGEKTAGGGFTIIDDGTYTDGVRTAPFDGEGVPTQRTVLVKDGVLQGYLYNTYTAAKEGCASTGNATRASFKSTPGVGPTNFYLEPGKTSPEDLMREIDEGLYVMEVMGMHTANPISGDFSVGASGVWIEKGVPTHPVRGIVIAGNMLELLKRIDAVGNDIRFFGSRGAPTFRVETLRVSGH